VIIDAGQTHCPAFLYSSGGTIAADRRRSERSGPVARQAGSTEFLGWQPSRARQPSPLHYRGAQRWRLARSAAPTGTGERRSGRARHAARPGGRAAERSERSRPQTSGEARRAPLRATTAPAGPRANPLSPRINYRIGGAPAPDGEKGGRSAVRDAGGKRGEPPRPTGRETPPTRPKQRPRADRGAGRSARRQRTPEQQPPTEAAGRRQPTQRRAARSASRRNDSGAGRRARGARREAQKAAHTTESRRRDDEGQSEDVRAR